MIEMCLCFRVVRFNSADERLPPVVLPYSRRPSRHTLDI